MRVEFHPEAQQEVQRAQSWYAERSAFAASAFLRELSLSIQHIAEGPERQPRAEGGTRKAILGRFPFTIYYRMKDDQVSIVAVAHQKRQPGYWSAR